MRRQPLFFAAVVSPAVLACQPLPQALGEQPPEPSWSEITPSDSSLPAGRGESAFARVGDKLVMIGGRGNPPTSIFDLSSCQWQEGAKAPFQIHHFQAVSVGDEVYAIGAFTERYPREAPVTNILIYNVATDSWRIGPEIPEDRRRGAAATVRIDDWIYVLNGIQVGHIAGHVNWADRYNIRTGEWQVLPDSPRPRDHLAAAVTAEGKIVVAGGRLSRAPDRTFQETVEQVDVFDPTTLSWSTSTYTIPTERAGLTAVSYRGEAVFLGGESGSQAEAHNEVEAFSVQSGFSPLPAMMVPRHGFGAISVIENDADAIYVAGGVPTRGGGTHITVIHRLGTTPGPCGG